MGSLYSDHITWLHRLSAPFKLACMAILGTTLFLLQQPAWLAACATASLLLWLSLGAATRVARGLMISVLIGATLVAALHLGWGRVELAMASAFRLVSAATLGVALTVTTRPADLVQVLDRLLSPLARLGMHPERVALQIALMMRFTEHFFVQWKTLDDAHRVRTGRRGGLRILAPLTVQMLQTARRVADALFARLGH